MTAAVSALSRLCAALAPVGVTALFAVFVMQGWVGFGGGEKDVLLLFPVAIGSIIFAVVSCVMWVRGASLASASWMAARVAFGALLALLVLGVFSAAISAWG